MKALLKITFFCIAIFPLRSFAQTLDLPNKDSIRFLTIAEALALNNPESVQFVVDYNQGYKELPKALYQFPNLKQLELAGNKIKRLPEDITQFKHLDYLDLSDNRLRKLPESIFQMEQLKYIVLVNNRFSKKTRKYLESKLSDKLLMKSDDGAVIWKRSGLF